ncbi:MAG TPA: VIT1/CCC1 transporter family protein [Candidatus Krumholzibacteria bacterium]|nr:VIT1/CCC1 transporter family protein [Candidatus Krumholzibacteria bacterium]HPD72679.1 VIT1/CCC1 transporter family protein [Candidatus Krumholzibacteria bacterium]HRY40389.1 VIT1/CCC1 transporter family protein [Candidatus Krumholzibacteria bacterium]
MPDMSPETRRELVRAQRAEITEHHVYRQLAGRASNRRNREVFARIAADEKRHYDLWRSFTGLNVRPDWLLAALYVACARVFGLTFGVKLMEKAEQKAQVDYRLLAGLIPQAAQVADEESAHENELLDLLDDQVLGNVGSIVLGLNDALVELTGALAGLTFAFQDTRLVALTGMITGVAASLSMAASEFLSRRAEAAPHAGRSALFTGLAYLATVALLILPYLLFDDYRLCLGLALATAVMIILLFTFYVAVAKDLPFRRRFLEMAGISLGVAALSFALGILVKRWLGVDV